MYKTVIMVHYKETGEYEVYSSLVGFQERHPEHKLANLEYHISRRKQAYETEEVTVRRVPFIPRE